MPKHVEIEEIIFKRDGVPLSEEKIESEIGEERDCISSDRRYCRYFKLL